MYYFISFTNPNWTTNLLTNVYVDYLINLQGSAYLIAFIYWIRHSLLLCLLLPFLLIIFIYLTVLFIYLYRLRYWLVRQLRHLFINRSNQTNSSTSIPTLTGHNLVNLDCLSDVIKHFVAALWDAHGHIFHGYEVVGMNKLPLNQSAYIVYYHGTCPFDAYYFLSRHCIERDRFPVPVVDRFLFRTPGLGRILEIVGAIEGSIDECVARLGQCSNQRRLNVEDQSSSGDVLLLAPGGVREALFSDEFYTILWGKRQGFARISLLSGQPIYPMFTENIREPIRIVQFGKNWLRRLYERTRLPIAIFYGYFPVKLRTYIGDPIYPRENETPSELAERVHDAMKKMIEEYQLIPSNLLCALLQRIPAFDRWLQKRKRARILRNQ